MAVLAVKERANSGQLAKTKWLPQTSLISDRPFPSPVRVPDYAAEVCRGPAARHSLRSAPAAWAIMM